MALNRIQQEIFKKLCKTDQLDIDHYIQKNSEKYLGKKITSIKEMTEKEADDWITKAYVESLE